MIFHELWLTASSAIALTLGSYSYGIYRQNLRSDTIHRKRQTSLDKQNNRYRPNSCRFTVKTAITTSLCLALISLPSYVQLAQAAQSASPTPSSVAASASAHSSTSDSSVAAPPLATNDLLPGVLDAATDALTKANITHQNHLALRTMNEQGMVPHLLANGTKQFVLTAAPLIWNLYEQKNIQAWGYNGQISGPVLRVKVGDTISIVLKNKLPEPTSLGFSGIAVPATMGGIPHHPVAPNASLTYTFKITDDMVGTHSYFSTTDMDKQINHGLHGVLLVDPVQGKEYPDADVNALFDIGSFVVDQKVEENVFTLNGKPYPNSPELSIQQGQHVLVRIVNSSAESFHAMHLHGYTFKLVAQDGRHLSKPIAMNVVSVAPEQTVDIEFTANAPGIWMFHCHILDHTINPDDDDDEMGGLMTNFIVHGTGTEQSGSAGAMGSMSDMSSMGSASTTGSNRAKNFSKSLDMMGHS
ncbi:multicopper oxidase family protein [Paenibacillus sp. SGZ-1009]|uniref:multicopper oxidase family protein n=1 Tax=Paenibacillus campi TaxID=3106031 RepID=UPI002AFEC513|nr:multicopper oxidase domain-containing protein [Paenibacillus sp. SGZ-1009]